MPICKVTFAHPTTGKCLTLHSAGDSAKFRQIMADCQKAGYVIKDFAEDLTDFRTSEGALMVLRHFMPIE